MEYMITRLIQIILDAAIGLFDSIGTSVVTVLAPNIGYEDSVFNMVFPLANSFLGGIGAFALALLLLNYVWQLVKIMMMKVESGDTPISLTTRTFFAGICMFWAPTLIRIAESVFSVFYSYLIGTFTDPSFDTMRNTLLSQGGTADPTTATNLVDLVLVLLITILIGTQFVMYLLEVIERYVILGVLYFTSPLAFSTAGSKSTSNIFAAWVRMVVSQLILMTFNVLFLRLFLEGASRFTEALTLFSEKYTTDAVHSFVLIWAMLLFGVLYVGTRVDTYMSVLGLSTAQTGRGMGAAMLACGVAARRTWSDAKAAGGLAMKAGKGGYNMGKNGISNYMNNHQSAKTQNGTYTEKTTKAITRQDGKLSDKALESLDGRTLARTMKTGMNGVPQELLQQVVNGSVPMVKNEEGKSVYKKDGSVDLTTRPNNEGEKTTLHMHPMDTVSRNQIENCPGVVAERDGQKFFVQGEGAEASKLATGGIGKIEEKGYHQKLDERGEAIPGVFEKINPSNGYREELHNAGFNHAPEGHSSNMVDMDGTPYYHIGIRDNMREGVYDLSKAGLCKENSPNRYVFGSQEDAAAFISEKHFGGMDIKSPEIQNMVSDAFVGERHVAFNPEDYRGMRSSNLEMRRQAFGSAFPEFKHDMISNISYDMGSGNFTFTRIENGEEKKYALVNSLSYKVDSQNVTAGNVSYTSSKNGINYNVVPLENEQTLGSVVSPTASAGVIGFGVQHYETAKTGGMVKDLYKQNRILRTAEKQINKKLR